MPNDFCKICQEPMPEYLWSPIHIKEFPDCCESCQDEMYNLELDRICKELNNES